MNLHFIIIDQRIIIFNPFFKLFHYIRRMPQSIFSFLSRNKNLTEWRTPFKFVYREFQHFSLHFRKNVPESDKKMVAGNFQFFASFKSYDYFSEENACFVNFQSLTACQKQTRQRIIIPDTAF